MLYTNPEKIDTSTREWKIWCKIPLKGAFWHQKWYPFLFCFTPSVKIGDCALWHQKWLSMLALMLTTCCTLQIVWHRSSMQKPVVCSKYYIDFSLPMAVIEYIWISIPELGVLVVWSFYTNFTWSDEHDFFGWLALELDKFLFDILSMHMEDIAALVHSLLASAFRNFEMHYFWNRWFANINCEKRKVKSKFKRTTQEGGGGDALQNKVSNGKQCVFCIYSWCVVKKWNWSSIKGTKEGTWQRCRIDDILVLNSRNWWLNPHKDLNSPKEFLFSCQRQIT